jgi:hypothetical protein
MLTRYWVNPVDVRKDLLDFPHSRFVVI